MRNLTYPPPPAERARRRAWAAVVRNGLVGPRQRKRPRSQSEAAWLLRNGTPPRLVGPVCDD